MPSFIITSSSHIVGRPIDALLCGPGATGYPDPRDAVPVRAMISERSIRIDDEPRQRAIISCTRMNGTTTYLVDGSTAAVRNRERRAALSKALAQLQQLAASLRPLQAESEDPALVTEGLGLLYNWVGDERERLTEGPCHG